MKIHRQLNAINSELASIRVALHQIATVAGSDKAAVAGSDKATAEAIHRLALALSEMRRTLEAQNDNTPPSEPGGV